MPAPPGGPSDAAGRVEAERAARIEREREAWLVLVTVPGLGPVTFARLLAVFGSAVATLDVAGAAGGVRRLARALASPPEGGTGDAGGRGQLDGAEDAADGGDQRQADGGLRSGELARRICEQAARAGTIVDRVRRLGLAIVTLDDDAYPERLRLVEMPPPLLFVRGDPAALQMERSIAVVGTRRATDRGRRYAAWIASAVARAGALVVSGLAVGIDGAAHAAVVAEGLPTVAVLGGGHACLFPRAHEQLADAIAATGGAVVSELPPDTSPNRGTFPRRNRLISGLADATIVVEAGARSGALITAGWALEQGRECYLVPGPLDAPSSAGCHAFLRSFAGSAHIVAGVAELLEDLGLAAAGEAAAGEVAADGAPGAGAAADAVPATAGPAGGRARGGRRPSAAAHAAGTASLLASLGGVEAALAREIGLGAVTADQLAAKTGLPVASILSALTLLELRGLVMSAYGRYRPAGPLLGWPGSTGLER